MHLNFVEIQNEGEREKFNHIITNQRVLYALESKKTVFVPLIRIGLVSFV